MDLIVAISGASGAIYRVRLLEVLKEKRIRTHLIVTKAAEFIIESEVGLMIDQVRSLATFYYDLLDLQAPISSGTFKADGMAIVPCSMKTLAAIAQGFSHNLVTRAADVTLKERRPLVIVPRESPLNVIHIRNMLFLAYAGAIIIPPVPAFYSKPKTIDDIVNYVVGRVLDIFYIEHNLYKNGVKTSNE